MLTITDITAKIIEKLRELNCPIMSKDVKEGYDKQTLYIYFDEIKSNDYMQKFVERKISVATVYFPADDRKNTFELLEVQEKLTQMFVLNSNFSLSDDVCGQISEVRTNIRDGVLTFDFNMYVFEAYDEQPHELMQDLEVKGE